MGWLHESWIPRNVHRRNNDMSFISITALAVRDRGNRYMIWSKLWRPMRNSKWEPLERNVTVWTITACLYRRCRIEIPVNRQVTVRIHTFYLFREQSNTLKSSGCGTLRPEISVKLQTWLGSTDRHNFLSLHASLPNLCWCSKFPSFCGPFLSSRLSAVFPSAWLCHANCAAQETSGTHC